MGRARRMTAESDVYHVVSRGVGKQIIFEDASDRVFFLQTLFALFSSDASSVLAWCLMDNHVHLLLKISMDRLSETMRNLNSKYAMFFNAKYKREGHVFQGRFKSEPVEDEAYLLTVVRYIHKNPEHAGICSTRTYRWSSYRDYISGTGMIDESIVMGLFGNKESFVAFHDEDDMSAACTDISRGRKLLDEDTAVRVAREAVSPIGIENIKGMRKPERDEMICRLRKANLSIRQIERLTGISRSVVFSIIKKRRAA